MKSSLIIHLLFLLAAGHASAALLVGNLSQGASGASDVSSITDRLANAFTTPASIPNNVAALDSITLGLLPIPDPQTATISLWTDTVGSPGSQLSVGFDTQFIPSSANITFTPTSEFLFAPSTTYWVVLEKPVSEPGGVFWLFTFTGEDAGSVPGASVGGHAQSADSGSSWGLASGPYSFAVNGTAAIPEPSSAAFIVALLAAAVFYQRRIRRS